MNAERSVCQEEPAYGAIGNDGGLLTRCGLVLTSCEGSKVPSVLLLCHYQCVPSSTWFTVVPTTVLTLVSRKGKVEKLKPLRILFRAQLTIRAYLLGSHIIGPKSGLWPYLTESCVRNGNIFFLMCGHTFS